MCVVQASATPNENITLVDFTKSMCLTNQTEANSDFFPTINVLFVLTQGTVERSIGVYFLHKPKTKASTEIFLKPTTFKTSKHRLICQVFFYY